MLASLTVLLAGREAARIDSDRHGKLTLSYRTPSAATQPIPTPTSVDSAIPSCSRGRLSIAMPTPATTACSSPPAAFVSRPSTTWVRRSPSRARRSARLSWPCVWGMTTPSTAPMLPTRCLASPPASVSRPQRRLMPPNRSPPQRQQPYEPRSNPCLKAHPLRPPSSWPIVCNGDLRTASKPSPPIAIVLSEPADPVLPTVTTDKPSQAAFGRTSSSLQSAAANVQSGGHKGSLIDIFDSKDSNLSVRVSVLSLKLVGGAKRALS